MNMMPYSTLNSSRAGAWLAALRLPFYPMSWLAYTLGCSLAAPLSELWGMPAYWWGCVVVFMVEGLTVFLNEIHDLGSDRRNKNHGKFTGGSRVLVEGLLAPEDLRRGCILLAAGTVLAALMLQKHSSAPVSLNIALLGVALILGVGYTVPPLKFSYRGCGEVVVAFAHSFLVVQSAALVISGKLAVPGVVEVSLPLFCAIIPSISLSGIPDRDADKDAGKNTLIVKFGVRPVVTIAVISALAAFFLTLFYSERWPMWVVALVAIHTGVVILSALSLRRRSQSRRIDGVMIATLSYVLWFATVPLLVSPRVEKSAIPETKEPQVTAQWLGGR